MQIKKKSGDQGTYSGNAGHNFDFSKLFQHLSKDNLITGELERLREQNRSQHDLVAKEPWRKKFIEQINKLLNDPSIIPSARNELMLIKGHVQAPIADEKMIQKMLDEVIKPQVGGSAAAPASQSAAAPAGGVAGSAAAQPSTAQTAAAGTAPSAPKPK